MNKHLFPRACEVTYLDTAAEGLPPLTGETALMDYWREKSRGTPGRARLFEKQRQTEEVAAKMLGTTAENIVLLGNSSEALNLLANSMDWQPGDEVLVSDLEFPSNVVVWLRLKEFGVRLVVIPTHGGVLHLEDWTSRLSSRTRIASVSQVSYKTGTQISFLDDLAKKTHEVGALFCVDATQALGRVPVSVKGVDYLVASSYKWLLGTHGIGVVYMSPEMRTRMQPKTAGWYSVQSLFYPERFESFVSKSCAGQLQAGMPNFPGLFALAAGMDFLLSVGVDCLNDELRPLVAALRSGLEEQGLDLLTPDAPEFASGIVSFACDDATALAARLAEVGVIVWGGDERVRISIHVYNDRDDVDRCLNSIRELTRR